MKVGTDGVMLGAWTISYARERHSRNVLDIGTGSGLIALMLAQELPEATITGIDIDGEAIQQASQNFSASPWANRLCVIQGDVQSYSCGSRRYDLIVSNPPFFNNSLQSPNGQRTSARHTKSLTHSQLLHAANRLLTDEGCFSLILPSDAAQQICRIAHHFNLYPQVATDLITKQGASPKRTLLLLSRSQVECIRESLLMTSDYYRELVSPFYLHA
ncbi:MAG: methyltransferase [Paludibacteraceae bacterium]|nr:methyltransferase [Paludibacteraceae bacterium]